MKDRSYVPDNACPWTGLRPFGEEDAKYFLGRDEEIETLIDRLKKERFLAVVGSSGRGKSSLVRSGVVPALRREVASGQTWRIKVIRPTHPP